MNKKAMSKEEWDIVVRVMDLLRRGKISSMTPNCEVLKILLSEKIIEGMKIDTVVDNIKDLYRDKKIKNAICIIEDEDDTIREVLIGNSEDIAINIAALMMNNNNIYNLIYKVRKAYTLLKDKFNSDE